LHTEKEKPPIEERKQTASTGDK